MMQKKKIAKLISKFNEDHLDIYKNIGKFDGFLAENKFKTFFLDPIKNFNFFKHDIQHHFNDEEQHLFCDIVLLYKSERLTNSVLQAMKEHGRILSKIEFFEEYFLKNNIQTTAENLEIEGALFFKILLEEIRGHAKRELEEIFSFFNEPEEL